MSHTRRRQSFTLPPTIHPDGRGITSLELGLKSMHYAWISIQLHNKVNSKKSYTDEYKQKLDDVIRVARNAYTFMLRSEKHKRIFFKAWRSTLRNDSRLALLGMSKLGNGKHRAVITELANDMKTKGVTLRSLFCSANKLKKNLISTFIDPNASSSSHDSDDIELTRNPPAIAEEKHKPVGSDDGFDEEPSHAKQKKKKSIPLSLLSDSVVCDEVIPQALQQNEHGIVHEEAKHHESESLNPPQGGCDHDEGVGDSAGPIVGSKPANPGQTAMVDDYVLPPRNKTGINVHASEQQSGPNHPPVVIEISSSTESDDDKDADLELKRQRKALEVAGKGLRQAFDSFQTSMAFMENFLQSEGVSPLSQQLAEEKERSRKLVARVAELERDLTNERNKRNPPPPEHNIQHGRKRRKLTEKNGKPIADNGPLGQALREAFA